MDWLKSQVFGYIKMMANPISHQFKIFCISNCSHTVESIYHHYLKFTMINGTSKGATYQ